MSDEHANRTLRLLGEALIALAESAPASHTVTVTETVTTATTWTRARLWDVPDNTRLTADDLAAALGIARDALYKRVKRDRIPHRRGRDKALTFIAGDVRRFLEDGEVIVTGVTPLKRLK